MSIYEGYDDRAGAVCVLSGGLDSTVATALAKRYFNEVHAITFFYGQKQEREVEFARTTAAKLGIRHLVVDISFLGDIVSGVSSNIASSSIAVPSIREVLGSPQPVTYVPNRNAILLNIAAAYAESNKLGYVITGLQTHDTYGYYDTTPQFIEGISAVWDQNRLNKIRLLAPFILKSKKDELQDLMDELGTEGFYSILKNTLTCYDPDEDGVSCGRCPSCAERINAFIQMGLIDPIDYQISIHW